MAAGTVTGSAGALVETSREPQQAWVPPRLMLRAAFIRGRAFWIGLFSGPAAFLLIVVLVGLTLAALGAWGTFWAPRDLAEEFADPRFYLAAMAFGGVFILVAVAMLRLVLTSRAHGRRLDAKPALQGSPWTWDHPWQPDAMGPDDEKQGAGGVIGPLAVLALIALFNIALSTGPWGLKLLILAFDAFGLLLLYNWVTTLINAVRFRRPTIAWRTFPSRPGGPLEATVRFAAPLNAAGPATVTLRCLRDMPGGLQAHPESPLEAVSIYREVRAFSTAAPLASLDISFQVPHDLPGTDLARTEAVYWQVLVQVPTGGPDFEAVFLAPVYAETASRARASET